MYVGHRRMPSLNISFKLNLWCSESLIFYLFIFISVIKTGLQPFSSLNSFLWKGRSHKENQLGNISIVSGRVLDPQKEKRKMEKKHV